MSNDEISDTEARVWGALEPYLETVIHLDLNVYAQNLAFQELVRTVAAAVSPGEEDPSEEPPAEAEQPRSVAAIRELPWFDSALSRAKEVLAETPPAALPSSLRDRPEFLAAVLDGLASSSEEIEYEYADANLNGTVMTNVMESSAYMGPVTRMRRRKAGPWEPVPEEENTDGQA